MSKEYRKRLGFTNGSKLKEFFTGKDIRTINWSLIESYNDRLTTIFTSIQSTLSTKPKNIESIVQSAYRTIRSNDILYTLNNNGRSPESVYYSWMQGYLIATVFQSFIEKRLDCKLTQNGADDLSDPSSFKRKSDPDLVDHEKKIFVEIQGGFKGGKIDIKRSKINAKKEDYQYYIVCIDCYNGQYCVMNTRELLKIPEDQWYKNELWEGALCYTIPKERMERYDI